MKKVLRPGMGLWYNPHRFRNSRDMNGQFQFWWWRNFGLMTGARARIRNW